MASSLRSANIVIGELVGGVVGIEENIRETEIAGNDPITLSTDVPLRKRTAYFSRRNRTTFEMRLRPLSRF